MNFTVLWHLPMIVPTVIAQLVVVIASPRNRPGWSLGLNLAAGVVVFSTLLNVFYVPFVWTPPPFVLAILLYGWLLSRFMYPAVPAAG